MPSAAPPVVQIDIRSALARTDSVATSVPMAPGAVQDTELPVVVRIADCPHLQELAWQLPGDTKLSPKEALQIYERNWRHLSTTDRSLWDMHEQDLRSTPIRVHGKGHLLV